MWRITLLGALALALGCAAPVPVSGHYVYDAATGDAPQPDLQRAKARCVERYGAEPDLTGLAYGDWLVRTEACMRLQGWEFVPDP